MRLNAELEIAKIRVSRKNTGASQGPLIMYLMLKGDVSMDQLESLFPTTASYEAEIADRWDEEDELRYSLVTDLDLEGIKGVGVRFEIKPAFGDKLVFQTADVDLVKVSLRAGRRVDLSMRVLVTLADAQIAPVITYLGNVMQCDVWSRQEELDLRDDAGDEAGDEQKRKAKQESSGKDPEAKPAKAAATGDEPKPLVPGQKPPQRPKSSKASASAPH